MAGNLVPVTKSGEQLHLIFHAFRENRLPFIVRLKVSLFVQMVKDFALPWKLLIYPLLKICFPSIIVVPYSFSVSFVLSHDLTFDHQFMNVYILLLKTFSLSLYYQDMNPEFISLYFAFENIVSFSAFSGYESGPGGSNRFHASGQSRSPRLESSSSASNLQPKSATARLLQSKLSLLLLLLLLFRFST